MYNVGIVGATGIVGTTILAILEERNFPIKNIYLLASHRSVNEKRLFKRQEIHIEDIATFDFSKTAICFFCTTTDITAVYVPKATAAKNIVIDKSAYFRNDPDVPLIVPEVNAIQLKDFRKKNIIANPNCNTIPIAVALKPIYDACGIVRMNIATYQSVSGAGKDAMAELTEQTSHVLNGKKIVPKIFSQQIAFNILPYIDELLENGYTKEEIKIVSELKKLFNDDFLAINPTAVRVPVYCGHSAAVHIETKHKLSVAEARAILAHSPGVVLNDAQDGLSYTPLECVASKDAVYVSRVRKDLSHPNGLNFWIVADNLRKGAALNGVQIAEELIAHYL